MLYNPGKTVTEDVKQIINNVGTPLNALEGKNILITGAGGLYGSYFIDTLIYLNQETFKTPCKIVAIQRTNPKDSFRLKHLVGCKYVDFVKHDASKAYKPVNKIDYLIHSAGMATPALFTANPLGTIDVNVKGIRWILEYAKRYQSEAVLFLSSMEIYGNATPENNPIKETYTGNVNINSIRACYAESKRLAEVLCIIYANLYGVNVKIARPSATYGPGITVNDKRVIGDFLNLVFNGKPIVMKSEGKDVRAFCYISDAITAFFKILLQGKKGEAYNVSTDIEKTTIADLANTFHKVCNITSPVKVEISNPEYITSAPSIVYPDLSKINRDLGFRPTIKLDEGLHRLIEWNREITLNSDKIGCK